MKTSLFIILFLIVNSICLKAQSDKPSLKWGGVFEVKMIPTASSYSGSGLQNYTYRQNTAHISESGVFSLNAKDETGVYIITQKRGISSFSKTRYHIAHFNQDLMLDSLREIDFETQDKKGNKRELHSLIILNKDLYLFSSAYDKKADNSYTYAETIDKKTLKSNNNLKKLDIVKQPGTIVLSADSSKIGFYTIYRNSETKKIAIDIAVYDNKLNPLWSDNLTLSDDKQLIDVSNILLDNSGNFYLAKKIYFQKRKWEDTKLNVFDDNTTNFKYFIIKYDFSKKITDECPIESEDKLLNDLKFIVKPNNEIICAGFYSNGGTENILGYYFLKIDLAKKLIVKQNYEALNIFFNSNTSMSGNSKIEKSDNYDKEDSKDGKGYYFLNDFLIRTDGSVVILAEKEYVKEEIWTDEKRNTEKTTLYFNKTNILLICTDSDGEFQWATKVGKKQGSVNDGGLFLGYDIFEKNNKVYLIFNDNPENIISPKEDKIALADLHDKPGLFTNKSNTCVAIVEIDKNGNQKRELLSNKEDSKVIYTPRYSLKIHNGFIILGRNWDENRIGKIAF